MRKIRTGETATSFNHLPPEIAYFIFLRLPVKTLIRSSAVNRTWFSLIKHPDFLFAQISRSISPRNENSVLIIPTDIRFSRHCTLISAETGLVVDKYKIPFNSNINASNMKLVGSVNGLLCLTDYCNPRPCANDFRSSDLFEKTAYQNLYFWNPSLRKCKCIVSSCFRKRYGDEVKISYALGFGFHEPADDYRVVRIMYFNDIKGNQFGKLTPRAEVFSLRTNKWRPLREIKETIVLKVTSKIGTTVNSTVYWINERTGEGVSILSFDFKSEVFGQIKLPDDVCKSLGENVDFQLHKFEGSICVCVWKRFSRVKDRPFCIWLISHKNDVVSSTLRFRVALPRFAEPLNITKDGALLMASLSPRSTSDLLSFDLKSMDYKHLKFHRPIGSKLPHVDTSFIESLCGDELLTSAKS